MDGLQQAVDRVRDAAADAGFILVWIFLIVVAGFGALALHEMKQEQLRLAECRAAQLQQPELAPKDCGGRP